MGRGVTLRSVFIFLRGSYFQNAIQLGNLYLDAANDTAHPEKPKLDWSPIRDLDYENLESWSRFAEVATRYLKVELYPNLHFPLAFPVTPFLAIHGSGSLDLLLAQRIIFHKDCAQGMRRTLALLDERKWMSRRLPEPYDELLRKHCDSNLYTAFPLEYAPCDSNHLRKHVIPEFVTLLRQKPEAVQPTLKSYSELITTAVKTLRAYNLRPAPAVLEQLRADGLIPELSEAPAAVLPES